MEVTCDVGFAGAVVFALEYQSWTVSTIVLLTTVVRDVWLLLITFSASSVSLIHTDVSLWKLWRPSISPSASTSLWSAAVT